MTEVAELYVRVDRYRATEESVADAGEVLDRLAYAASREVYPFEVRLEVYLEPGSLRTWTTVKVVGGILLGAYGVVATYSDVKIDLKEIVADAKQVGSYILNPFNEWLDTETYSQRRTKMPGRLLRNLERLERFEEGNKRISKEEFASIEWGIRSSLDALPEGERRRVESIIIKEHAPRLPDFDIRQTGIRGPEPPTLEDIHEMEYPARMIGHGGHHPELTYFNSFDSSAPPSSPFDGASRREVGPWLGLGRNPRGETES